MEVPVEEVTTYDDPVCVVGVVVGLEEVWLDTGYTVFEVVCWALADVEV